MVRSEPDTSVNNYEKNKSVPYNKGGRPGSVSLLEGGSDIVGSSGARHPRSRFQDWYLESLVQRLLTVLIGQKGWRALGGLFHRTFPSQPHALLMLALPIPQHQESAFQHMDFRATQTFQDDSVILTDLDAFL